MPCMGLVWAWVTNGGNRVRLGRLHDKLVPQTPKTVDISYRQRQFR